MSIDSNSDPLPRLSQAATHINPISPANHRPNQANSIPRVISPNLTNILPSNQPTVVGTASTGHSVRIGTASSDSISAMETGPGPLRHPKPLTAVDLYAQLEKEQEAVVNRLTRELSFLRAAQNASVVSNTSSTSASGLPENNDYSSFLAGHSHPTSSHFRRHRSSSTASSRSLAAGNSASMVGSISIDRAGGRCGIPIRHDNVSGTSFTGGNSMSRQNSVSRVNFQASNQSEASSPITVPSSSSNYYPLHSGESWSSMYPPYSSRPAPLRDLTSRSPGKIVAGGEKELQFSSRYDEVALYRIELENAKKENEMLKRRVRELEALVNKKKQVNDTEDTAPLNNEVTTVIKPNSEKNELKTEDDSGGVRLAESTGVRATND